MYLTYILAQKHIVNWEWHLEKLTTITNYTRSKQKVNRLSFILCGKESLILLQNLTKIPAVTALSTQNECNFVYFWFGTCVICYCCQLF